MRRILLPLCFIALFLQAEGQVNDKGRLQLGLGLGLGVHATHFENEVINGGDVVRRSERDRAVTFTFPIEAQLGLSPRFGIGLHLEPGSYLDSAGTRPNKLFLFGLTPRYYALNEDRFALHLHADLGLGNLRIGEVVNGAKSYEDRYAGGYLRIGVAMQWFLGGAIGLQLGVKQAWHTLEWKEREPMPALGPVTYSARLKTSGVLLHLGLVGKF